MAEYSTGGGALRPVSGGGNWQSSPSSGSAPTFSGLGSSARASIMIDGQRMYLDGHNPMLDAPDDLPTEK